MPRSAVGAWPLCRSARSTRLEFAMTGSSFARARPGMGATRQLPILIRGDASRAQGLAAFHKLLTKVLKFPPFFIGKVTPAFGFFCDHPIEDFQLHLRERLVFVLLPPLLRCLLGFEKCRRIVRALWLAAGVLMALLEVAVRLELSVDDPPADRANGLVLVRSNLDGQAIAVVLPALDQEGERPWSEFRQLDASAMHLLLLPVVEIPGEAPAGFVLACLQFPRIGGRIGRDESTDQHLDLLGRGGPRFLTTGRSRS